MAKSMNEKGIENCGVLKDFVQNHELQDRYSNIDFEAIITIETSNNKINKQQMDVQITFDGYNNYGTVSLLESLDTDLFPIQFLAQYQHFENVKNSYLRIFDVHPFPLIGKYEVTIFPLKRKRD